MERWKRGIWGTAGAALVILALGSTGAWYLATRGTRTPAHAFQPNPLIVSCGIVLIIGMYMAAAALGDWWLPGRAKARQVLADLQRLETLGVERRIRVLDQLSKLIEGAKLAEIDYLASGPAPPDESGLAQWSNDARACIANIDVKLLRSFDQELGPAYCTIDGQSPAIANIVGLLRARAAFLAQIRDGMGRLDRHRSVT